MTDYTDIILRLTEAEGPSRELDAHVWAAFRQNYKMKAFFPVYAVNEHDARTQIEFTEPPKRTRLVTGAFGFPHADPWSSSLDAAIALCEMRLPAMWGRKHEGANFDEEGWSYEIRVGADDGEYHLGIHNHEPIALLIAMFRALQAQDRE